MITKLKNRGPDRCPSKVTYTDRVIQKTDNLMYDTFPRQEYLTEVWLKVVV